MELLNAPPAADSVIAWPFPADPATASRPPSVVDGGQYLQVDLIEASPTNPRKTFEEKPLAELAESIGRYGVLQPVLVRPHPKKPGRFELVAGERRWRASKLAGEVVIPALVRDISDIEALELQVIENLQREDVHPLEEAEGYERLLAQAGKIFSVDDIAARLGRSKAYVYGRLKLTALVPEAREAYRAGKLTASTALMVARIPVPDLQRQAIKELGRANTFTGEPMSASRASDHLQRNFMLRLDRAPFKTADAELVPAAGACGPCPKRSGNAPELFGDVERGDLCTDPVCHAAKRAAHVAQVRAAAEARGQRIITGKQAKAILPYEHSSPVGHVRLDDRCYDVPGDKTYRKLLGKDVETVLVELPATGDLVELVPQAQVRERLLAAGHKLPAERDDDHGARQREAERKRQLEMRVRREILDAVRAPRELDLEDLRVVATAYWHRLWTDHKRPIGKLYGWSASDHQAQDAAIAAMDFAQLGQFLLDMALAGETLMPSYGGENKPERLLAMAARRGVDAAAIRKRVMAEERAKKASKVRKAAA